MSIFDLSNTDSHLSSNLFFGKTPTIARYDKVKYPWIEKLTEKQLSFFWRPEEVEISRDAKDFKLLTESEKHIFTSNIKRQILLDSVQGRAPSTAFGPICSLPELEVWIQTWAFSETIHSRSYTYLIKNVYPDPSSVFDTVLDIPEIVSCAGDISKYYDILIDRPSKEALLDAVIAVNALEGIRFYVSFACSWNFAETKRMEGNAKIIKLIARDENLHLAFTQQLIKSLIAEDPEMAAIFNKNRNKYIALYTSVVDQEKEWAEYLFKEGSMVGLTDKILKEYIEWIANRRMTAIGLETPYKGGSNPLPWTQRWISGSEVQVAPQQTGISSYLVGELKKDLGSETFKHFKL